MKNLVFAFWVAIFILAPKLAHAQYKNFSFGLDFGYSLNTRSSPYDASGLPLQADRMPLRLSNGYRIGLESNFKMLNDHFWFSTRFNTHFLKYGGIGGKDQASLEFDRYADNALGTILGIEPYAGVRYVIMTDQIRPYLQAGLSYMRLFTFTSRADAVCSVYPDGCSTYSNQNFFLSHPNIFSVHIEPGFEWVFTRNVALRVFVDMYRWVLINTKDNNGLSMGMGITFFT